MVETRGKLKGGCQISVNGSICSTSYSFNIFLRFLQESKLSEATENEGLNIIFTVHLYRNTQYWVQLEMRSKHKISFASFPDDSLSSDRAVLQYRVSSKYMPAFQTRRWRMIDQLRTRTCLESLIAYKFSVFSPTLQNCSCHGTGMGQHRRANF